MDDGALGERFGWPLFYLDLPCPLVFGDTS